MPACRELFQPDICKNEYRLLFWYLTYDLYCKMLYHPLFAAIITSNIFLRVSIKRVLLEYEIPPFSNTRRKWLTLAAIGGEVTRGRFISHNSSVQGRSNLFFLPFFLTVSTQSSKELEQLNYFSHLTSLSSTVQFSRLKGLWLHIVIAPIAIPAGDGWTSW